MSDRSEPKRIRDAFITCTVVVAMFLGMAAAAEVFLNPFASGAESEPRDPELRAAIESSSMKRMEFLEGAWSASMGGDTVEEVWSAPSGTHLMGMMRWVKADESIMLMELMSITIEDTGFVMYLRHFDGALTPWASEADGPLKFRLADMDRNEKVRWEPVDGDATDVGAITYHRQTKKDMTVTVEFGGDRAPLVFAMTLKSEASGAADE